MINAMLSSAALAASIRWSHDPRVLAIATILIIYMLLAKPHNMSHFPGLKLYAFARWELAYDWEGTQTKTIHQFHQKHGPFMKIGPIELSFNSLLALKTIYGAGSAFQRASFYHMFDVYG
jgi:hypothetical protein